MNASTIKATSSGPKQELIPRGMYRVRIAQVLDLGLQPRKAWKGVEKTNVHQLWVTYELTTEFMKDGDGKAIEDKPRWIKERMNLFSLDQENATSTKRMEGIDPEGELNGDWTQVGGRDCLLQIVHSKDKQYANIGSVSPSMAGVEIAPLQNEAKIFNLDEPDMDIYNGLPDFLKEIISGNLEFRGSALEAALAGKPASANVPNEPEAAVEDDDDIPY